MTVESDFVLFNQLEHRIRQAKLFGVDTDVFKVQEVPLLVFGSSGAKNFDLEVQWAVWGGFGPRTRVPVGEISRNREFHHFPETATDKAFVPALDYLPAPSWKSKGVRPFDSFERCEVVARIKFCPIRAMNLGNVDQTLRDCQFGCPLSCEALLC